MGSDDFVNANELVEQSGKPVECERVLPVALGLRRVLVHFHEHAVDACRHARRRHRIDEFRLAARHTVAGSRQLQAVRHVVDDRMAQRPQDREGPHVDDEVVVAESEPALGDDHARVSARGDLLDRVPHVERREELALLDVDTRPVRAAATRTSV